MRYTRYVILCTVRITTRFLGASIVVPPQGPDLILAAHIPAREGDVLILHSLHVKPCSRPRRRRRLKAIRRGSPQPCVLLLDVSVGWASAGRSATLSGAVQRSIALLSCDTHTDFRSQQFHGKRSITSY